MTDPTTDPRSGSSQNYRPDHAQATEPGAPGTLPTEAPPSEPPETRRPEPPRGGRLHRGNPPTVRRAGRTAAVLGAIGFVILVTVLSTKYSHAPAARPAPDGRSAPVASAAPLTAERIEDFARRHLERRLRAARPAPPPPDLEQRAATPSAGADRTPFAPSAGSPRPAPGPPARPALTAPLTPRGASQSGKSRTAGAAGTPEPRAPSRPMLPAYPELPGLPELPSVASGTGVWPATGPATATGAEVGAPSDPSLPAAQSLAQRRVALSDGSPYPLTRRPAPVQPVVYAGTAIPLTLTRGLASDVPGPVRALVTSDVYDSPTHRRMVLPRGTLVLGHQAAQSAAGDQRVLIAWTELKLPGGASYSLPEQPAGSADGTAGARGRIDNHWWSRIGSAVGLSLVGAGIQLSQPQNRTAVQGFAPSEGQILAQHLGLELGRLSQEVLRRGVNRAPTITLRPGQRLTLLLTRDLLFPDPRDLSPSAR